MGNTVRKTYAKVINIHEVSNAVSNVNANQAQLNRISIMDTTELKIENNSDKNENLTTNEKTINDDEDWIFKCFTCGFRATNFSPYLCDSCGFMSNTVIQCIKHHELHHALKDGYLCAVCGFSTFDFYAASVHNKNYHRKRKREFDDCSEIDLKRVKSQEDSTLEVGSQTETEDKNISEESTQTECEKKIETKDAECQTDEIYENSTSTLIRNSTPLTMKENEKLNNFQSFNETPNNELSNLELRNLSDLFCITLMNMVKADPSITNSLQLPTCSNVEQNINAINHTPLSNNNNLPLSLKQENSVNSRIRVPEIENQMILMLNKIKDSTKNEPNEETPNDTTAPLNSRGSNERGRSSGRRGRGSRGPRRTTGGRAGSRRPVGRPKKLLDDDFVYPSPKASNKLKQSLMSFSSSDEDDEGTTASTSTTSQPVLPPNRENSNSDSDELPEFDFLSQP